MSEQKAVAVVGLGAVLPDAPDVNTFWENIQHGHYSIKEVPADRWNPDLFYHPDPTVTDKTYSKIGSWVQGFTFDPLKWGIPIPPRTLALIDETQQWAIAACRQALVDYGYPKRSFDPNRVAVILGNAMAGEQHYRTNLRIHVPELQEILSGLPEFLGLQPSIQSALLIGMQDVIRSRTPIITEDTMPGELSNIIAGRVANAFNLGGPNYVIDAACASSLAALQAAVDGLNSGHFDLVLTGGVDRNMGASSFVKFSKIGALSPDGSRPFADGANGFVMGEGAAVYLLKRLDDAERDNDRIYAVIRGIGSSSDGRGKGITAPNPAGQQRAIERAWINAGVPPSSVGLIEAHGTSTPVGDVTEVNSLFAIFGNLGLPVGSVALGSVKSNIGHLKSAAGAAGLLKTTLALYKHMLPVSVNFEKPNPKIDFDHMPFFVNTHFKPWDRPIGEIRRAGVSSFGFGGTNFHVVLEEYIPGATIQPVQVFPGVDYQHSGVQAEYTQPSSAPAAAAQNELTPYGRFLFLASGSLQGLKEKAAGALAEAQTGCLPASIIPDTQSRNLPERLVIDYSSQEDFVKKCSKLIKVLDDPSPAAWQALTAQGIFHGSGPVGRLAFLFPGQGSQYVNMLKELRPLEPVVEAVFREADEVMTPILGKPLSAFTFAEGDEETLAKAESELRNTTITQPAVLTANIALLRLMEKFGFTPDMVIGHSLGEYAALVASGVLTFAEALQVVSARGREMVRVSMGDNGAMAAVSAPLADTQHILASVEGYVVIANINSPLQSVIGGSTAAVDSAVAAFLAAGFQAVRIPVSHAFHTRIVAPASEPLRLVIARMKIQPPRLLIAANVTGESYPDQCEEILDLLAAQVASPVQFIKGMETLYQNGGRVFVEVGPKRVLNALATDIFKSRPDVTILATNHPRKGALASFKEAICGLYAAGVLDSRAHVTSPLELQTAVSPVTPIPAVVPTISHPVLVGTPANSPAFTGMLPITGSVVVSGAGLGLPGGQGHVFEDDNIQRLMLGENRIESLPEATRQHMLDKNVTRLVKSEAGATLDVLDNLDQTIKLAGQGGAFNLEEEFGIPGDRSETYDVSTRLAIAAGIEALRDAHIPLVMTYRKTSKGTYLPNRWMLPESLADETGVIFASAFPGLDRMAEEAERYYEARNLTTLLQELRSLMEATPAGQEETRRLLSHRIGAVEADLNHLDYHIDRKFVFRVLAMGHSQFAEYVGARGPNTHVNAACATTTHAVSIAEDWIRAGRCRRVVIIAGDDVTGGSLVNWVGTGLLASGATTTEGNIRMAALPFDRRRNGMIMGMGAAALVIESEDAVRERGVRGICEVLAAQIANSAYHGTRLDIGHVSSVMERLLNQAEVRFGISRTEIAPKTVFVSHETYTPARGGSASAEIQALRKAFGSQANQVVIANTKGFTGHTMGVGVEDVIAAKALELGTVPPIANIQDGFEPDPELGDLNLSRGGSYPVQYSLRLGAGFGSQIAMTLMRKIEGEGPRVNQPVFVNWLSGVSGYPEADLEVVQRTLRIRHDGPPVHPPAQSSWQFGQPPSLWSSQPAAVSLGGLPASQPLAPPLVTEPEQKPAPVGALLNTPTGKITDFVLSIASEKTGYPSEMLDLDLDLEADLGIDTVKQAELFAAVRSQFGIPRREDLRLADYNTLAKVIRFVEDALPTSTVEPVPVAVSTPGEIESNNLQAAPLPGSQPDFQQIQQVVLNLVSQKTGYPAEMLDLDLDLEADLGIDTVKQAELFAAVRGEYGIPRREDLRLADYNTLDKVIRFVIDALPTAQGSPATPVALTQPPAVPEPATAVPPAASAPAIEVPSNAASPEKTDAAVVGITSLVLSLVSEKTGYPVEMLELDLDLESDLGIDTVKQAELFASVRTHYGFARREDLRLADYNTLAKVIQFVQEGLALAKTPISPVVPEAASVSSGESTLAQIEEGVNSGKSPQENPPSAGQVKDKVVQRRIPLPVLRPKLDLCLPTGVELNKQTRVVIIASAGSHVASALVRQLKTHKVAPQVIHSDNPPLCLEEIGKLAAESAINGVYFLPALDDNTFLDKIDHKKWTENLAKIAALLFQVIQAIPGEPFLVCASRMGGLLGLGENGAHTPMGGAVSGFAKALSRERPSEFIKLVDFSEKETPTCIASILLEETLHDPGVVEVGWSGGHRFGVAVINRPLAQEPGILLNRETVYLVSGGAGGISIPVLLHLAKTGGGRFYLLGRSSLPVLDDPDLLRLETAPTEFKQELARRMTEGGQRVSPARVEEKMASLKRLAAASKAMVQMTEAGAAVEYLVCDVTDFNAVEKAVQKVKEKEGRVNVLIHTAGFESSRRIEKKSLADFETTLAVKATGLFNLVKALQLSGCQPDAVVGFTSVAGRFGNAGQTDYSAANDLVSKMLACLQPSFPGVKTLAIDWGAWADVGMASRGSLPEAMARAGIEMMPPSTAAPLVHAELVHGSRSGEVILAGALGSLLDPPTQNGGMDIVKTNHALTSGKPIHVMFSRVTGLSINEGLVLEADLDPSEQPFLKDHALNGVPLLPGVMGIEGFAVAARHVASAVGSSSIGFQVTRLEDIHFLAPIKFYRDEPRRITWKAQAVYENGSLTAEVTLESTLALKSRPPEKVLHFTGRVLLEALQPELKRRLVPPPHWNGAYTVKTGDIYRLYFHGPSFQVLEGVQVSGGKLLGKLRRGLPPLTGEANPLVSLPQLLELCLQTAGIWEAGQTGVLGLPSSIEKLTLYDTPLNGASIFAEVTPGEDTAGKLLFDARVVDARGHLFLEMGSYRTTPLPYRVEDDLLKPLQELVKAS